MYHFLRDFIVCIASSHKVSFLKFSSTKLSTILSISVLLKILLVLIIESVRRLIKSSNTS